MKEYKDIKRELSFETQIKCKKIKFVTTWGIFSPKKIDDGAILLINLLPDNIKGEILDMGCGYGPIGIASALLNSMANVTMIDKDYVAVEYCKKNIDINNITNAQVILSNTYQNISETKLYDYIFFNLPGKAGKEFLTLFLRDTKDYLKKNGILYLSAIKGITEYCKKECLKEYGNFKKTGILNGHTSGYSIYR